MDKEKQSCRSMNSEFLDDGGDDDLCEFSSDESSMDDSSNSGASSVSSSDCVEDASSSSTSSSSVSLSNGHGPLYELSDLMAHLPIKKGLSKFYDGKSQSFTSLASVRSIDDLAKKEIPFGRKLKLCKSYGGNLNAHKSSYSPKATISKKASKGSFFSNSLGKKGASVGGCRHPMNSNPNSPRFSRPDDA